MGKLRFLTSANKDGQIETIEIGGLLILETASELKNEFLKIVDHLSMELRIHIYDLEEMDLPGVQILVAFFRLMDKKKIAFQVLWTLEADQKEFFANLGIGVELYMNN